MTHADLVKRAAQWLRGTMGCVVVATERQDWRSGENPDAIGWLRDGRSILVECKTSREDFVADQRKPHRRVGGMGLQRFYFTELGLLRPDLIPQGWGLAEVGSNRVRVKVHALWRESGGAQCVEMPLLVAMTRRAIGGYLKGVSAEPEAM